MQHRRKASPPARGGSHRPPAPRRWHEAWLVCALALLPAPGAAVPTPQDTAEQSIGCLIEPERAADVGASSLGTIDTVEVERGDTVRQGQLLATLRSDLERANLEAARQRVLNDGELQSARALRDGAREKLRAVSRLAQLGGASPLELDQARAEFDGAEGRVLQAEQNRRTAEAELQVAQAQMRQKTVVSPFAGVVVERHVHPGERTDGKPMFRIAALQSLRVEMVVPTAAYAQFRPGMAVNVTPDYPNARPLLARVARIDRQVDAASATFRVRLQLPNPQGDIPAGLRCAARWDTAAAR